MMKWNRLKDMECPKCKTGLVRDLNTEFFVCLAPKCAFKIGRIRFNEVVEQLYKDPRKKFAEQGWDDRMAELNNLGRQEDTEGFGREELKNLDDII